MSPTKKAAYRAAKDTLQQIAYHNPAERQEVPEICQHLLQLGKGQEPETPGKGCRIGGAQSQGKLTSEDGQGGPNNDG